MSQHKSLLGLRSITIGAPGEVHLTYDLPSASSSVEEDIAVDEGAHDEGVTLVMLFDLLKSGNSQVVAGLGGMGVLRDATVS